MGVILTLVAPDVSLRPTDCPDRHTRIDPCRVAMKMTRICQCHADGVGRLAPRLFLPSWLVSLVRLVDVRGPADLA